MSLESSNAGALVVESAGAAPTYRMAWYVGPAGVVEQGKSTRGSPGTWEARPSPCASMAEGEPWKSPGPRAVAVCGPRERIASGHVVPPSEGNEVRRDERSGVAARHSTWEAGEPGPPGPCGGKGVPSHGALDGNRTGAQYPGTLSTQGQRIADLRVRDGRPSRQRNHDPTNRMR